ncbi:MAG TPA: carboxymuconolactone decarboxylase family protein [Clostridia bacterium]|nr:carboxymuconolactone decarboxylase family protein [Clostridia bacterium]
MPKFIDELKGYDPEFHAPVSTIAELAMAPGALDGKTKLLIAIALDALGGHKKGVENLAKAAKKAGVSKEEVAEALRLAYFVAGNGVLALAGEAFEEFEEDDDDDDDDDKDDDEENEDDDESDSDDDENDDILNDKEAQNPYAVSTLAVFDEKMIYGPSYLVDKD